MSVRRTGERPANSRAKPAPEVVLLVLVRDGKAVMLRRFHDDASSLPYGDIQPGESPKDAGRRLARERIGAEVKVKSLGQFRMDLGDRRGVQVVLLAARTLAEIAPFDSTPRWEEVGKGAAKNAVSAQFSNEMALTALRDEVAGRTMTYAGPRPLTPRRRLWLWLLGVVVVITGTAAGVDLGVFWNSSRLSTIDPRLAYDHGYIGELGSRELPRPPRGIGEWHTAALLVVGWFGVAVSGFLFARGTRLVGLRRSVFLTIGLGAAGWAAGFWWHSRAWVEPRQGGPDGHPILYYADTWLTALAAAVSLAALVVWYVGHVAGRRTD